MSVFSRFKRIVKSNINALLDKAEDPQKVMEQAVLDMQAEQVTARESLTQAMVDERKLAKQLDAERGNAEGWRAKAGQLLSAGNETAAKEALVRAKQAKEMLAAKEKELESHRLHVQQMKVVVEEMGKKIEMAKVKKLELSTRLKAASHAQSLSSDLTVKEGDAFKEWARFVDKIEEDETRTEIMREMSGEKLQDELSKAETLLSPEEDELEKLKREMGIGQAKLEDKSEGDKK